MGGRPAGASGEWPAAVPLGAGRASAAKALSPRADCSNVAAKKSRSGARSRKKLLNQGGHSGGARQGGRWTGGQGAQRRPVCECAHLESTPARGCCAGRNTAACAGGKKAPTCAGGNRGCHERVVSDARHRGQARRRRRLPEPWSLRVTAVHAGDRRGPPSMHHMHPPGHLGVACRTPTQRLWLDRSSESTGHPDAQCGPKQAAQGGRDRDLRWDGATRNAKVNRMAGSHVATLLLTEVGQQVGEVSRTKCRPAWAHAQAYSPRAPGPGQVVGA